MTDREAIKMAFDTLVNLTSVDEYGSKEEIIAKHKTMGMLRQALAQPEQEPVGWFAKSWQGVYVELMPEAEDAIPFYTAPPKREWVGLTDDELAESLDINLGEYDLCLEIEAKLKEKNK